MTAMLLWTLPTLEQHPTNTRDRHHVDPHKAVELTEFRATHAIPVRNEPATETLAIPDDVKLIINDFYQPWLISTKSWLETRNAEHLELRCDAFMRIVGDGLFKQALQSHFDEITRRIAQIKRLISRQHHERVSKWNGPDFKHLKYKIKDEQVLDHLTVIYNKNGFQDRCGNSQEDWFRKLHGDFFAKSIEYVAGILQTESTQQNVLRFLLETLQTTIRFTQSKNTDMIPNRYMFGGSRCQSLQAVIERLVDTNLTAIAKKKELIKFIRRKLEERDREHQRVHSNQHSYHENVEEQKVSPESTTTQMVEAQLDFNHISCACDPCEAMPYSAEHDVANTMRWNSELNDGVNGLVNNAYTMPAYEDGVDYQQPVAMNTYHAYGFNEEVASQQYLQFGDHALPAWPQQRSSPEPLSYAYWGHHRPALREGSVESMRYCPMRAASTSIASLIDEPEDRKSVV